MSKIIVALDRMDFDSAFALTEKLKGRVWGVKLRLPLLLGHGVSWAKKFGNVMVDPKCYDIASSMADDVVSLAKEGADLVTLHAKSNIYRMQECVQAAQGTNLKLLAVTVLTDEKVDDITRRQGILDLSRLAHNAGVHGIVCCLPDIPYLAVPQTTLKVCPGFRPPGIDKNEQQAVGGYKEARQATLVVIGRPITMSPDPVRVVEEINQGFAEGD
jgi:orotidine-5'-phosphate decarboxylase